jgi:membrane-bound lytic murein transglycosylase B
MKRGRPGTLPLKVACRILILMVLSMSGAYGNDNDEIASIYQPLVNRLSQDGIDTEFLSKVFLDSRLELIPSLMSLSLSRGETQDLYTQFLSKESILLSKKFLRQNLTVLRQMEKRFHVEKEVVVAILLVESRFGENIGKIRVIPALASMALMDSPENLQTNYLMLCEIDPDLSCEWVERKIKRKANWAYRELKCFLEIVRNETMDPLEIRGSYAGALGMAQFMPSSYLAYAQRKKSFEKWLLSKEEAVFSIGNYLRTHGWKKNLTIEKKRRILWYYNHSEPYIETILQVAREIRHS